MSSAKKKIIIAILSLGLLFVGFVVSVPFWFDVDTLRPRLMEEVNKRIDAKLEISRLSLSIWSGLKVHIEGMKLTNSESKELLSLKGAEIQSSIWSALLGSPYATLVLSEPKIEVIRDINGKINLLKILKQNTNQTPVQSTEPQATSGLPWVMGYFINAKLNFKIENGAVLYQDLLLKSTQNIDNLNFELNNIGINQPINMSLAGDLKAKLDKQLQMSGPFFISGTMTATTGSDLKLQKVDLVLKKNLDKFLIVYDRIFKKDSSVPLNFGIKGKYENDVVQVEELSFVINDTELKGSGAAEQISSGDPKLNFKVNSNTAKLDNWHKLLPSLQTISGEGKIFVEISNTLSNVLTKLDIQILNTAIKLLDKPKPFELSGNLNVIKSKNIAVKGDFSMFSGKASFATNLDISQKEPRYTIQTSTKDLDIKAATEIFLNDFSNTITGKLSMDAQGTGKGVALADVQKNLDLKGKFQIKNATLKTIDVINTIEKVVKDSTNDIVQNFPELGEKLKLKADRFESKAQKVEGEYSSISGAFTLNDSLVKAPDFSAVAVKDKGLDLKGNTTINLTTKDIKANWNVVDRYNLLKLDAVNLSIDGHEIKNVLADKKGVIVIPLTVGCLFVKPCFDYEKSLKYFRDNAESKLKNAVKNVAKSKLKKELNKNKEEVKDKTKNEIKNILKKIKF